MDMTSNRIVNVGNIEIGNTLPLVLVAGPCQMESRNHALDSANYLKEIAEKLEIKIIFKTSFDKANRTSGDAGRGIGLKASIPIFSEIKERFGLTTITDVHDVNQCSEIGRVVDILQIPAFLCRQTDLLIAAARTGKVVNVKKGQFLAPWI